MKKKYAVPVDHNGMLKTHFGNYRYFALYDVEEKTLLQQKWFSHHHTSLVFCLAGWQTRE